jgi:hypothetical protein
VAHTDELSNTRYSEFEIKPELSSPNDFAASEAMENFVTEVDDAVAELLTF